MVGAVQSAGLEMPVCEVLLVDDDAAQREMYRRRIERAGFRVRLADSADAAVEQVRTACPGAVVQDIAMPGRDGLSALQELVAIEATLPVIINTAYGDYAENFLAWAADAFVRKSAEIAPRINAISRAVGPQKPTGG